MVWTARRARAAVVGAVATALLVGLPTDVVPNPVFGRAVPVTWWSYPVLAAVAVLSGLLLATYVRLTGDPPDSGGTLGADDADGADADAERADQSVRRRSFAAGMLSFFAVGCPVCNKVVLLALGTSGALTWFAPVQPVLALASVAGLAWALRTRLRTAAACAVRPSAVSRERR